MTTHPPAEPELAPDEPTEGIDQRAVEPASDVVSLSPLPRINFLNALRGIAVGLVLWDHMASAWPTASGFGYRPQVWAAHWFFLPLGIVQDGGFLGVVVFFLVSGFIVTRVAERENLPTFLVRRVLRIFPLLVVLVLISVWWHPGGLPAHPGAGQILRNMLLLDYVSVPQVVLIGVGWTLIIEVIFYALVGLTVALCRLPAYAVLATGAAFVWAVLYTDKTHGPRWFLFSVSVSYLPLLFVGQVIHYRDSRRIGLPGALISAVALLGLWEWGVYRIYPQFMTSGQSYPVSAAFGIGIFLLALRAPAWFGSDRFSRYLADRSYAVYLLHGLVGFATLNSLHRHHVPFTFCLIVAVAVVLACAEVSWWVLERPMRRVAHWVTRRRSA